MDFEYAAETVIRNGTLTATVPLGASVRWLYEHVITIGQSVTIDLHPGGNWSKHHGERRADTARSNYAIVITWPGCMCYNGLGRRETDSRKGMLSALTSMIAGDGLTAAKILVSEQAR